MRKRHILSIFLVLIFSIFLPWRTHAEWVRVDRVIDGDTFITSDGKKVRIKNIDTPETNHPYKGKESGGEEAKKLAVFFLEGNYVWLNGKTRDKYGRRLATVKLRGGQILFRYCPVSRA
ncbi:MAG: thermonuclease family protein [Thermodesulfobacteriota bacterium]